MDDYLNFIKTHKNLNLRCPKEWKITEVKEENFRCNQCFSGDCEKIFSFLFLLQNSKFHPSIYKWLENAKELYKDRKKWEEEIKEWQKARGFIEFFDE